LSWVSCPAWAAEFYVDPQNGSPSGDGSAAMPWRTLQDVIDGGLVQTQTWESFPYVEGAKLVPKNAGAPIHGGDTIWLLSGYHGTLSIVSHYNSATITIAAAPGATPKLSRIVVRSSAGWLFRGLQISPSFATDYDPQTMVQLEQTTYHGPIREIVVEGCRLFSVPDSAGWSANDWDSKSANGISADGEGITLRNNRLTNVNFGISVSAHSSLVEGNLIENFAGDGMRGLGDYTVFQYNTVKNCYKVNDNHDDGFQSWSVGSDGTVGTGEVTGVVLRGNRIINYEDPNQPFRCTLQGIGMFDGTFVDWVIENNIIITDHWHGITLLGARGSRVVNNTVLDPNDESPGPPWIKIAAHKDGTPPEDCVVRNNLATDFTSDSVGVTEDHNLRIDDAMLLFVNPTSYDLHLLPNSPAIDKGDPTLAPAIDIDGTPRPVGSAIDLGAYEWTENPPDPDAGYPNFDVETPDRVAPDGTATGDSVNLGDSAASGSNGSRSGSSCSAAPGPEQSAAWLLVAALLSLIVARLLVARRRGVRRPL
ncbi:MAG: right-handed parallel beta-helix repeat-containing protein, partial [Myxococcales bacterium]|nr:right-handed parallel beta-helix repeat-containing protein [Myxococcales bacterium]